MTDNAEKRMATLEAMATVACPQRFTGIERTVETLSSAIAAIRSVVSGLGTRVSGVESTNGTGDKVNRMYEDIYFPEGLVSKLIDRLDKLEKRGWLIDAAGKIVGAVATAALTAWVVSLVIK